MQRLQVFHKDQIASIAKGMGLFEVKIFARVINRVMQRSNFISGFLAVVRWLLSFAEAPLLFPTKSALRGNKAV